MENVLSKRESLKMLEKPYFQIKNVLESVHYGEYHRQLLNIIKLEEKEHRKFKPEHVTCGLTIGESVYLFYVQTVFEYLYEGRTLSASDYISVRKSHFLACSLVENYREELLKACESTNWKEVQSLDYAKLMQ